MPRRNQRERYEPVDLTAIDPVPLGPAGVSRADREKRAELHRIRVKRQRDAALNGGIDWSICLVPGCGASVRDDPQVSHRCHDFALPLCLDHLFVSYRQAKSAADEDTELCVEANARVQERRQAIIDAAAADEKRAFLARQDGDIYFIKLNGLVKVGWSRDLYQRVRSYGASAELLVSYPATRDDETNLHRQLRPALAKGREWYEDGAVIQSFINEALAKYGKPNLVVEWTTPKRIVAGKRHR